MHALSVSSVITFLLQRPCSRARVQTHVNQVSLMDRKNTNLGLDARLHTELKVLSARRGVPMRRLIEEAILAYLASQAE